MKRLILGHQLIEKFYSNDSYNNILNSGTHMWNVLYNSDDLHILESFVVTLLYPRDLEVGS
jgi:hypothetical protein